MEKKDVKPFIDSGIKDTIYKLSFVTGYSVKSICEDLCSHAIRSGVGKELSPYFKRPLKVEGVVYQGEKNPTKFEKSSDNIERVSMKIDIRIYEFAYSLSYAIGCSVAKVIAFFIEKSMNDFNFLNHYVSRYLSSKMDESKKEMLKIVMGRVNENLKEEHSIASLLLYIVDEHKQAQNSVPKTVEDFVLKRN